MTPKQLMIADGAPKVLFMTAAQRAAAWKGVSLRAVPLFRTEVRDESPDIAAFRAAEEERKRLKSLAQIGKMKARMATKTIDFSKVRWDARRNKFVPIEPGTPKSAPTVKAPSRNSAVSVRRETTPVGADSQRVTKDNAETVAKLNGVWKPEYEKLRGTGRIVMTVGNVLRGITKRGGTVKWQ